MGGENDNEDFESGDGSEGPYIRENVSGGFSAQGDEDPFNAPSSSGSDGGSIKIEKKNQQTEAKLGDKSKADQFKSKMLKGKQFKFLKQPRASDNDDSALFDPEEEKLKILPECCEFMTRKNEYEDESRKDMSVHWFGDVKISPAQQKQLCFAESLLIVEETGSTIGKMYCSITLSKWADKPCFCVHAGSFGKFSTGLEAGTSITSFVKFDLSTQQEFVHEWATQGTDTIERKTFVMNEWGAMPCKISLTRNAKLVDAKNINLAFKQRENLVLEGANKVLQRLLILEKRTNGNMTLQSLSYQGKVVKAKYEELGSGWENVKGKQMKTWGIRRTVTISADEVRTWDSLYNKNARLILRCQPESPQALIPLWFESIIDFDKNGNFIGSYSPYAWACDMELYTKYTVKREETTFDHRRYIIDHPEVRALLSDYLQALLFRKPRNVVEFTQQYFESFLSLRVKPQRKSQKHLDQASRSSGAYYYFGSTTNLSGELGEGEWVGEDGDSTSFYPVNPKMNYEGLEKVDDGVANTESEIGASGNDTEDDLIVNEQGKYIHAKF